MTGNQGVAPQALFPLQVREEMQLIDHGRRVNRRRMSLAEAGS